MARTLAFPYKRGEIINTSPVNITFDEEQNGRAFLYAPGDLSDLLVDLRAGRGIHTPIWCRPITTEAGQGLKLVAGQRRLLAGLEYLKENPDFIIKVLVVEPKDDRESLEMNALENSKHKGLSIIDEGHIAVRLREEPTVGGGRTLDQIAEVLNIDVSRLQKAIKLVTDLPEVAQKAIHTGKVTVDDAVTVLKVSDPYIRRSMIEEFIIGKKPEVPQQPVGQEERPVPVTAAAAQEEPEPEPKKRNVRDAAREAGGKVPLRLPEIKKYLQEAIEEDGPGSNKGEVKLKQKLMLFVAGEISQRTMDDWFNKLCKSKGE